MITTILSILLALFYILLSTLFPHMISKNGIAILISLGGLAAWISVIIIYSATFAPLLKLENTMPHAMARFRNDKGLRQTSIIIYSFVILSIALTAFLISFDFPYISFLFAGWLVGLGITLDLLKDLLNRANTLLNPFQNINAIIHESQKEGQKGDDEGIRKNINNLTEVALRSIHKNKFSLSAESLSGFPAIVESFVGSSSISNDVINFSLFYTLQRLSIINDQILAKLWEPLSQHLITIIGKIILITSQKDLSLAQFPIQTLGNIAIKDHSFGLTTASSIASGTLVEIVKGLAEDKDIAQKDLQAIIQTIISTIDSIEKNRFKHDKSINVRTLTVPLQDLRLVFVSGNLASHKDTPNILRSIEEALEEYSALEQVMQNVPLRKS